MSRLLKLKWLNDFVGLFFQLAKRRKQFFIGVVIKVRLALAFLIPRIACYYIHQSGIIDIFILQVSFLIIIYGQGSQYSSQNP